MTPSSGPVAEPSHATRREYIKPSGERQRPAAPLFWSPSAAAVREKGTELRAGPGGPRPVLLADQLTIPPIFRIADTHLHTGRKPSSRDSRGETLRLGFTRAADVRH